MNESLGQRIKRLRKAAHLSQAQLAEACGWKSQSRVGNYEAGTREPTLADIHAIARALRVAPSALLLERAIDDSNGTLSTNVVQVDFSGLKVKSDELSIPQYDVRGAMGHGQVPPDYTEAIRNVVVKEALLQEKGVSYSSAGALAIITGWGQSMEGTINDKDPVIVDRGVTGFVGDGVYVITWHGLLYIKRLQVRDAESFHLISDNPRHKDQVALMSDVTIHAKVLLVWNAHKV